MSGLPCRLFPLALLAASACGPAAPVEWQWIEGGFGTGCGIGDPFHFFAKTSSEEQLFVFLGGGGACWDGVSCDVERNPRFSSEPDTIRPYQRGLLNDAHELNPFRDYSFLIIPYCTGDLNLGTQVVEYERPEPGDLPASFEVHHLGLRNVQAALSWIVDEVSDPETIVVGGQSGGAPASPLVASLLARHYPNSRVVQVGDAAGALQIPRLTWRLLQQWGADSVLLAEGLIDESEAAEMTLEDLYVGASRLTPSLRLSQINSVDDPTQAMFLTLLGLEDVPVSQVLVRSMVRLESTIPAFRFFLVEGDDHVHLSSPRVFEITSEEQSFVDWISSLSMGTQVESVGRGLFPEDPAGYP